MPINGTMRQIVGDLTTRKPKGDALKSAIGEMNSPMQDKKMPPKKLPRKAGK